MKYAYNGDLAILVRMHMSCLFCEIVRGTIVTQKLFEDDDLLAFRDIHPQAPTHLLIIPKQHIESIESVQTEQAQLIGNMILTAKKLAENEGLQAGYRLVFNINADGGQQVYHLHLHVLGGRQMTWPPG